MTAPTGPAPVHPERLRLTTRSVVLSVAAIGATLLAMRMALSATRVLGWIAAAAAAAALLHPPVACLARRVPKALAVLVVAGGLLGTVGLVGYGVVDSVRRQTAGLEDSVPDYARQLEGSKRFGPLVTESDLVNRSRAAVQAVPRRLQGGDAADAIRANATRGIAFLATGVLTLFFLLHGQKLLAAGLGQLEDDDRRRRVATVAGNATRRAMGYARGTIAMAVAAGLTGYLVGRGFAIPAAAPLGLWVALWDIVPLVGALIGALPIVVIAGLDRPAYGITAAIVFVVYQVLEALFVQRQLERRTLHLGPFLTAAAGFAGLELYGLGGAFLLLLAAALVVATLDELAPPDDATEAGADEATGTEALRAAAAG